MKCPDSPFKKKGKKEKKERNASMEEKKFQ